LSCRAWCSLEETFTGRGISDDRLFYCRFLFEDVPTPAGMIDIVFEVWALPTRNVRRGAGVGRMI